MTVYAKFDQTELDREYSPSSCVDDINVYLDEYARLSKVAKQAAMDIDRCQLDLRYGENAEHTLDLFLPDDSGPAPLHVFIHGGYWQALSKDESCFAAPTFQRNGCHFAAVNYTLAPHQTLSGIVDENRRAVAWLYKNADQFGFDPGRIFLSGSSAGAHLAIMMLLTEWSAYDLPQNVIKGVCALSGVYDLEPIRLSYVNELIGMNSDEAAQNSPALHSIRNNCPVILAYGDNETSEFKRQTDDYRIVLANQGIAVTAKQIVGRNHFDIVFDLLAEDSWLFQQVLKQMQKN